VEDDATLREYAHEGMAAVAERLGRSGCSVYNRAFALKVSLGGGQGHRPGKAATPPPVEPEPAMQPEPKYHCCSRELVPSCPLRTEQNDCTGDFPREKYPPTVDECKAAAMPVLGGPPSLPSGAEVHAVVYGAFNEATDTTAVPTCRVCGCTDERACEGGCFLLAGEAALAPRDESLLQRYVGVDVKPILEAVYLMASDDLNTAEVVYDTHSGRVVALVRHPTQTGIGASTLAAALSLAEEALEP
jgi:hypothetical protein